MFGVLWLGRQRIRRKGYSVNQVNHDPSARVSARRRLIRGVFAAPAALTLYSGSAFAAASQSCVAKQVASPPPILPTASAVPDIWVRVQLYTLGIVPGDETHLSTWVSGVDVDALNALSAGLPYLSSTQWQAFTANAHSGYVVGQIVSSPPSHTHSPAGSPLTQNGAYVALRVDANGNIIGVVGINSGGSSVANTCWASFRVIP